MKKLASIHPRPPHVMHVIDDFNLEGPNGTHRCLVFELLGPSVPDMVDAHFPDGRLPGKLVKAIAKQVVFGLEFLHQEKLDMEVGHTYMFFLRAFWIVLTAHRPSYSQSGFHHTVHRQCTG